MATKRTKPGGEDRAAISQMVLDGMRSGLSAFKACEKAGISQSSFQRWVDDDSHLQIEYARAREDLIERIANEVMELSTRQLSNFTVPDENVAIKRRQLTFQVLLEGA
jgi:hypothetical protein